MQQVQETPPVMEQVSIESTILQKHIGRIFTMVSKVPAYNGLRIQHIEKLLGGLTNDNFRVRIGGEDFALRCAGEGTEKMIDRPAEDNNAHLMADAGINPVLYYYDPVIGDKIDVYIDGKTLHVPDFQTDNADEYIRLVAQTLNKVHNSGLPFKGKFDFTEQIHDYLKLIAANNIKVYDGHDEILKRFNEIEDILSRNPRRLTPTHNDPLPENWIYKDGRIYLIDWEYGGMGDPLMDVAAFSLEVGLTESQEKLLIKEYFGREAADAEYAMILINKFINDVLWYLWSPIQIFNGKPAEWYWNYGLNRFNRAAELINSSLFKQYLNCLK